MKLTTPQKEVIRKMREGIRLNCTGGYNAQCYFSNNPRLHSTPWPTITALEGMDLINRPHNNAGEFTLTELGKTIEL